MEDYSGTMELYRGLMQESVDVAAAQGVSLPREYVAESAQGLAFYDPAFTTSMQRDLMAGRQSEMEAQVGVMVRKGKETGMATPLNAFAYHALLPLDAVSRKRGVAGLG